MGARIRKIRHDENTRAKIQASQIVNRLQAHIRGEVDMPNSAVNAALGLLRKTLPDLAQVTLEGGEEPVTLRTIITGVVRAREIDHKPVIELKALPVREEAKVERNDIPTDQCADGRDRAQA